MEDPKNKQDTPDEKPDSQPTPTRTRIFAWIGVIFMVLLVLGYTYSVATGKIFLF